MQRGDVVVIAQKGVFSGKPRPAVIIQADALLAHHPSILVCIITSDPQPASGAYFRIAVTPTEANGLKTASTVVADQIIAVRRQNIGNVIGQLDEATIGRLNTALALFQGLT